MIPKIIHYCWFGENPKPQYAKKSIRSWHRYCKGYKFIEWNEDNYDLSSAPQFVQQAYEAKKWAFVTDYVRLWSVYHHGGMYFDTDIRLIRSPDALLENKSFFAVEESGRVATGLGFGSEANEPLLQELMETYEKISFYGSDGAMDLVPCGARDTEVFIRHGLKNGTDEVQMLDSCAIYPPEYFCISLWRKKTKNTYTKSFYSGSWRNPKDIKCERNEIRKQTIIYGIDRVIHFPNVMLKSIMGDEVYTKLKKKLKK